jgi:hypothetical protein
MDLWAHVKFNVPDSGFVSTTDDWRSAQDFAKEIGADYIYKIRATGLDVNEIYSADSPYEWENEVAVPHGISPANIEGTWGPDGWLSNSGYTP